MPVIYDISLSLKIREVLRWQGLGAEAKVRPEIKILIREILGGVKEARLLEPAVAYEYYTVRTTNGSQISLESGKTISGPLLPAIFTEAKELVIVVALAFLVLQAFFTRKIDDPFVSATVNLAVIAFFFFAVIIYLLAYLGPLWGWVEIWKGLAPIR